MKKLLLIVLGVLWSLPSFAQEFTYEYEGQTLTYTVLDEDAKTCQTKAGNIFQPGNRVSGNLKIPATAMDGDTSYTVTAIGDYAFVECSGLTSVTIPNSVTEIGDYAFFYCRGMTSVEIPNSVTSIGERAFIGCRGLTSVEIPNSVTSIGDYAFAYCSGLTSVTIPNYVTSIGEGAFMDCTGLTSVTIPNSVTSIGDMAFADCEKLLSIEVDPSNPNYSSIDGILYNIDKTELIRYPEGKKETHFEIPNSVTSIGDNAFWGCSSLTSVTIGNSVTSIGERAFFRCSGLTSVTIGNSVKTIGNYAFWDCSGLTSVTIPNSVTSIGNLAFEDCNGLTSVIIGNSVTSIGDQAFAFCEKLLSIDVEPSNPNYSSIDGILYNIDKTELIQYPAGKKETHFEIPNSVTTIGNYAFEFCRGLTSVTIPNSVTSIGYYAFGYCSGLNSVTIPNSVTFISYDAFRKCTGLTSVEISNSVTFVGNYAFYDCTSLATVYYAATEPIEADSDVFSTTTYNNATLYAPATAIEKCKQIDPWRNFANIEAHDLTGVETIEDDAVVGEEPCEVYDLNGVMVGNSTESLRPGLYIVRQGANVKKIAVK